MRMTCGDRSGPRRAAMVSFLLLGCGDDGGGTASAGGSSSGSTGVAASTGDVSTSTGPGTTGTQPTTGGSGSASASSTGPEPGTSTGAVGVTEPGTSTGPDEPGTSTGPGTTTTTSGGDTSTGLDTSSGGLTCEPPLVPCGDQCVDTDLDPQHCGGCGLTCGAEQSCVAGDCLDLLCPPGVLVDCYSGPPGTLDVGACKSGAAQCNDAGTELGPCTGDVVPVDESCELDGDEDCDGETDEGCFLKNCREIKLAQPAAKDGNYKIDLDGDDGPLPPFTVQCDMTLDGGGWTRFNWLYKDYVAGEDPLGQQLQDCKLDDLQCRGRIPAGPVTDLMVKDLTDKNHAMWKFNNTLISQAVLAALQSKKEYCGANQGAFAPYFSNSIEGYCGSGEEGGCDSFFYTSGACLNVGTWGMHFDGDNHWCAAAFKMGATFGGCGNTGDQGFLNDCDCDDEKGELYYR